VASLTLAFAEPSPRTSARIDATRRALSHTPVKALRLASAPRHRTPSKASHASKAKLEGVLNLNTASAGELTRLPGIGVTKASRIVQYRKKHGSFKRVVDLRRVKGFGRKTVNKLKPYLVVSGKSTLSK
jgi:competence protein ComEA